MKARTRDEIQNAVADYFYRIYCNGNSTKDPYYDTGVFYFLYGYLEGKTEPLKYCEIMDIIIEERNRAEKILEEREKRCFTT